MRARLPLLLLLFAGIVSTAQAQSSSWWVGAELGRPSGLTLLQERPGMDLELLAAWDLDEFLFLNAHGLLERPVSDNRNVALFYGPGVFIGIADGPDNGDDEIAIGVSGRVGLSYAWDRFKAYVQITPRISVIESTDGDVGAGIGFRFRL